MDDINNEEDQQQAEATEQHSDISGSEYIYTGI